MSILALLDTNIIIALFAQDTNVLDRLVEADEVFVPSISLGELYFGARKSAQANTNTQRIDNFAAQNSVLACDTDTARQYGEIKDVLRARGRPLPENDIWIAALAIQHTLTFVTRDAHFSDINNLTVTAW